MTLYRWQAPVQDEAGNLVPSASVTVRHEASGLLATLYSDKAGAVPLANPFTAPDGIAGFYAAAAFYRIDAVLGGFSSTLRDVNVGGANASIYDPNTLETNAFAAINHAFDPTGTGLAATNVQEAIAEVKALVTFPGALPVLGSGAALPTSDIGPIWHVDYAAVMTWQVFNANGASYTGYASHNIGDIITPGSSTARTGTLKGNGADLSTATYAPLYHWAKHSGLVVAPGDWTVGMERYRENGGGTFRLPDLRGRFPRIWSDGSSVDSGRAFGTAQGMMLENHVHTVTGLSFTSFAGADAGSGWAPGTLTTSNPATGTAGAETRPLNTALLVTIKF